jgi:hypothetical protein
MGTDREVSRIIVQAVDADGPSIGVPALCLVAAEAVKAGLTRHVGYLPSLKVMNLTTQETGTVGALIGLGVRWESAHAIALARQSGSPVVTLEPDGYESFGVETITLRKN